MTGTTSKRRHLFPDARIGGPAGAPDRHVSWLAASHRADPAPLTRAASSASRGSVRKPARTVTNTSGAWWRPSTAMMPSRDRSGFSLPGGGAEIFAHFLPLAGRLYWTRVHASVDGDVRFAAFDRGAWRLVESARHEADAKNEHPYSFELYERVS